MAFAGQISLTKAQVASLFFFGGFFAFFFVVFPLLVSGLASLEQEGRAAREPRPGGQKRKRERCR